MAAYIFKLQVTNLSFDRRTFCTSLSSVEIHFQLNRYFTTFIVFSTSRLFIYLCTTFIKRIIHNLICSDGLCMRNNVQGTFYIMFCKFMQFNKIFKTIFEYIRKKFRFVHTNTFCEYRRKLRASPRVHLVFLLYGDPSDQFLHILYGGPLRSVSSPTIWGSPEISFFTYYMRAPLRSISSFTIWGPH